MQAQRVLTVSLSHAIRSAAYLLLPFAFIALIAWATAGSASGSTTDPIRGALWIWLGAHHIPFSLALPPTATPGYLSYLPIGAIALPFIVIRSSFTRALDRLQGDYHDINGVRMAFSIIYSVLLTLLAYLSRSDAVSSQWYLAPIFGFAIAFSATLSVGNRIALSAALRLSTRILALLLGVALIVDALLVFTHFSQVKAITLTLQPGIFGGFLLLALNIFYLPSAAIATLSYITGSGFAVGVGTLVSPLWHHLGQLPALPLLGMVPVSKVPYAIAATILVIAAGALLAVWALQSGIHLLIQSYISTVVLILILAYLGSGSLLTTEMGAMGVSIWKFGLTFAFELGLGAAVTTAILNKAHR